MKLLNAYKKILDSMILSGWNSSIIARNLLYVSNIPEYMLTPERISLLSRGFNPVETEYLIEEGASHQYELPEHKLKEFNDLFSNV